MKTTLRQLTVVLMIWLMINLPIAFAVSINPDTINVTTTESSVEIEWATDAEVASSVFYGKTTSSMEEIPDTTGENLYHSILVEGLESNQKYFYQLTAADDAGTYSSNYYDFTTTLAAPQDLELEEISHDYATMSWNKVSSASKYKVYKNNVVDDDPSSTSYTIENLSPSTTYSINIVAVDDTDQESEFSETLEITTSEQPVNITFIQASEISKSTTKISWTTDRDTNGSVYYSSSSTIKSEMELNYHTEELSTEHEFTLKDLQEDTTYYFIVNSGPSESDAYSFTTLSNDTEIYITDIEVKDITQNSAEVYWTTNVETDGYVHYGMDDSLEKQEYHSDEQVYHTIELDNLNSGATYYYKIKSGNQESVIYSFETSENLEDFIDLDPVSELTNEIYLELEGDSEDKSKMYFFVNKDEDPGAQEIIEELNGTRFNVTLTLNPYITREGVKGLNTIEINAWNEEGEKAEKKFNITLDNLGPDLTVHDIPTYINYEDIEITGYTDADAYVDFLMDNQSKGMMTVNETGFFNKTISVGSATKNYTLAVEAIDEADNVNRWEKQIFVDRTDPTIDFITDFSGTTHYKLFRIDGQTEPNATVRVANFGEYHGCDDIEFTEQYGHCDSMGDVYGAGPDTTLSMTADILNLILGQNVVAQADENGNFTVIVALFSGQDVHTQKYSDLASSYNNMVGTNNIIFNITDTAGNYAVVEKSINYEPGCPEWITGKITSFPFNIYTEDMTSGEIDGSAIIELDYIGAGVPEYVQIAVGEDNSAGSIVANTETEYTIGANTPFSYTNSYGGLSNSNSYVSIGSNFKYTDFDESSRAVYVYVPLKISKYTGVVEDLPEQFGIYLDLKFTYKDYSGQTASCDVYPVLSFDVQKPESLAKWLSPEMINTTIQMLDDTINATQKSVDILQKAALWTLVACGAKLIWDYASGFMSGPQDVSAQELSECGGVDMKMTYQICDRVLCPSINPLCEGLQPTGVRGTYTVGGEDVDMDTYNEQKATNDAFDAEFENDYLDQYQTLAISKEDYYQQQWKKAEEGDTALQERFNSISATTGGETYKSVRTPRTYATEYDGDQITVEIIGLDETLSNGRTARNFYAADIANCPTSDVQSLIIYKGMEDQGDTSWFASSSMTQDTKIACSNDDADDIDPSEAQIPGCYKEGCPEYDETKCLFGRGAGHNPADGLIISLQCGCLTGAKAHLENLLQILQASKTCFESALIGQETAGACERLLSYFVCDILTEVMKYLLDSISGGTLGRSSVYGSASSDYQSYSDSVSNNIKGRYGSIIGKAGLSTDQLINKACIAAFNMDWSELEGVLDKVIDQVEVAPIIAADAYSRPYGYDPFTGRVSIGYNMYFGIVPGGETYVKAWLECDRTYPGGEYCAKGADSTPIDLVSRGIVRSHLSKNDFYNENTFYVDENAVSWYNKLTLQVSYQSGDSSEIMTKDYEIRKKGDLSLLNCGVSLVNGISCEVAPEFQDITGSALGSVQLHSTTQGSRLSPKVTSYYSDNEVAGLVKINNGYTSDNFYIRTTDNYNSLQYYANPGTDTYQYKATQYYLLWLDSPTTSSSSSSSSSSSAVLDTWSEDHENEGIILLTDEAGTSTSGYGKFGISLHNDFQEVDFKILPAGQTETYSPVSCNVKLDSSGLYNTGKYGIFIDGKFYEIDETSGADAAQTAWEQICAKTKMQDLNTDCNLGTKWASVDKDAYDRIHEYNSQTYYMCLMPEDVISTTYSIKGSQVTQLNYIEFDNAERKASAGQIASSYTFPILFSKAYRDNNPSNAQQTITTTYTSTTTPSYSSGSSSSQQSQVNVLSDMNSDGCGESKIYSADADNPEDQEFKFEYSFVSSAATGNLKPVIDFIEPITIIEQSTGYVNNDNRAVPIGFTLWDDQNNEISTISIGILRNDKQTCQYTFTYDKSSNTLSEKTHTGDCVLTANTDRSLGFEDDRPAFFELDLGVDGVFIKTGADDMYDITIGATDSMGNPSQPVTKRIRFDQVSDPTQMYYREDMMVCLGSSSCSTSYETPKTECAGKELTLEEQEEQFGTDEQELETAYTGIQEENIEIGYTNTT